MKHYGSSTRKLTSLLILSAAIAACGGGGGSSGGPGGNPGGGNPGGDGGTGLPGLSGLSGDADNHDVLYFSHNTKGADDKGNSILYAIDVDAPETPHGKNLTIEDIHNTEVTGDVDYVPLYEADIDADDGSVENYRVTDILFRHNRESGNETSEGFARVRLNGATEAAVRFSSVSYDDAFLSSIESRIWQNYTDTDNAEVSYGPQGIKKYVGVTDSESEDPRTFPPSLQNHVTPVGHIGNSGVRGYISIAAIDNPTCTSGFRLTTSASNFKLNGNTVQLVTNGNLLPDGKETNTAVPLGGPLRDGSQYLAINTLTPQAAGDCTAESALWRYDPSKTYSSRLTQVLDENGDPLIIPLGSYGTPLMPAPRHLARQGDVLYFGIVETILAKQNLYRVEGDSWSLLSEDEDNLGLAGFVITGADRVVTSVGHEVVSWNGDGSDRQVIDETAADWEGAISTEALGSRDGWIFYTRADINGTDYAVAMKIDGSDSMEIPGAQWIGASSSGKGDSISNMTELSEVFLWRGKDIAAVSAADPKAGMVVLGSLAAKPESVTMHGLAPGPHRLIQVQPGMDEDITVAYYVNTREANSLRKPLNEVGYQRPVNGF